VKLLVVSVTHPLKITRRDPSDLARRLEMNGTVIQPIVDYLATLDFEDIPCEVLDKAKLCILDTLGVALAGSTTSIGKLARQYAVNVGGRAESTIYGYGDRVSCVPGAYANGTMAFCHNFTDTTLSCVVHCGPVIVPASLAVSEKQRSSGKDFLAAVVAGYETMTRIGNVVNSGRARMSQHKRGFHPTATTGVFGASLAAGKLLKLNKHQMGDALGIAGSYASGVFESGISPGAETWRTHTGIAAQNGISSALLAELGLHGPLTILEGKSGFFSAFGERNADVVKMTEDLGKRFLILDASFKLHNCAHVWAIPLDCLGQIIKRHLIRPEDVTEIRVMIPTMYSYVMDESEGRKYPKNYAEAQNNLAYVMAAMMVYGGVLIEQFSGHVLEDPRMKAIASKVVVQIDPSLDEIFMGTGKSPARIKVGLKNGEDLFETADYPHGSPQNPATRKEIEEKFVGLSGTIFEKEKAWKIVSLVNNLDQINDCKELIDNLIV
jgi:2-methylcitrate dehydratase PrpD